MEPVRRARAPAGSHGVDVGRLKEGDEELMAPDIDAEVSGPGTRPGRREESAKVRPGRDEVA